MVWVRLSVSRAALIEVSSILCWASIATSSAREKLQLKRLLAEGLAHVAIGTHALIQEDVEFKNLGLAVIDEQHRFGVMQRLGLATKGLHPDVLVMTATPIPRTLAMTIYGDLDTSVIDELRSIGGAWTPSSMKSATRPASPAICARPRSAQTRSMVSGAAKVGCILASSIISLLRSSMMVLSR